MQTFTQVLIALFGALSPVVVELIRQRLRPESPASSPAVVSGGAHRVNPGAVLRDTRPSRSLLDLSIVLTIASIYSLIIVDSILISGRVPLLSLRLLLWVVTIVLTVTSVLVFAWWNHQSEVAVAILGLATAAVLVLSPGGAFVRDQEQGGEAALALNIPLGILAFLISASVIYRFGNPLSTKVPWARRSAIGLSLFGLVALLSFAAATQYARRVYADKRTPHFTETADMTLISDLRGVNQKQRGLFYQLASDVQVASIYRAYYYQLVNEQTSATKERPEDDSSSSGNPGPDAEPDQNSEHRFSQLRASRLQNLRDSWRDLEPSKRISFLSDRLTWVHPIGGADNNGQSDLPIPGTSAQVRFNSTSNLRQVHSLLEQSGLRDDLTRTFRYDQAVFRPLKTGDKPHVSLLGQDDNSDSYTDANGGLNTREHDRHARWAFPILPPQTYKDRLLEQLALPQAEEGYLAYAAYQDFAKSLVTDPGQQKVFEAFTRLPPDQQRAFLHYVIDDDDSEKVFQQLLTIVTFSANDLRPLQSTPSAPKQLATLLTVDDLTQFSKDPVLPLVQLFRSKVPSADVRTEWQLFLRAAPSQFPIDQLLRFETLQLVAMVNQTIRASERKTLFTILRNPVAASLENVAEHLASGESDSRLSSRALLLRFSALSDADREALLLHLAISLYRAQGPYALEPLQLLIAQARTLSQTLAVGCAALLIAPFLVALLFAGAFIARKVLARDRILDLIQAESARGDIDGYHPGIATDLIGRDREIERLKQLSGRGWSTIGIVGRRGIGKSRILYEIHRSRPLEGSATPNPNEKGKDRTESPQGESRIAVWISSPARFDEDEFVASTLRALAVVVERAVGRFLNAKLYEVRRLERSIFQGSVLVLASMWAALSLELASSYGRLVRPEIIATWVPILFVSGLSAIPLLVHFTRLQPVDLSPWLERDRTSSPHTVLLYRSMRRVFAALGRGRTSVSADDLGGGDNSGWTRSLVAVVMIAFGAFIAAASSDLADTAQVMFLACGTILVALTLAASLVRGRARDVDSKLSGMALISTYRSFVEELVYRLRQGALGQPGEKGHVVVCVDELDKIVEMSDLRNFLRRMKTVFEIPGCFYYLSLAEDAWVRLYSGPTEGKNELDSSLDHVVRIDQLDFEISSRVAADYLRLRLGSAPDGQIAATVAALSFGVPRDILRLCDEVASESRGVNADSRGIIERRRLLQLDILRASGWISPATFDRISSDARAVRSLLVGLTQHPDQARRAIAGLWIVTALGEAALGKADGSTWLAAVRLAYAQGFRLASDPIEEVDRFLVSRSDESSVSESGPKVAGAERASVTDSNPKDRLS